MAAVLEKQLECCVQIIFLSAVSFKSNHVCCFRVRAPAPRNGAASDASVTGCSADTEHALNITFFSSALLYCTHCGCHCEWNAGGFATHCHINFLFCVTRLNVSCCIKLFVCVCSPEESHCSWRRTRE